MISGQLQPIRRDLDLMFSRDFSPSAQAQFLAEAAAKIFAVADTVNADAMGQVVPSSTYVDGRETSELQTVRADGSIVRVWHLLPLALVEIGNLIWQHSPVRTGAYQWSHALLADGVEIAVVHEGWEPPAIPAGVRELVFVSTVPYARLIEPVDGRGAWSSQAPDGVYHAIAALFGPSFSRLGTLSFGYRELAGVDETIQERRARPGAPRDLRQPAIIIVPN